MSRCGFSLRCSCYIGDNANNVYAVLWVLFTLFMSHLGHCLQCLCNVAGIDYNVHVTFWALPTMSMQYCGYCLNVHVVTVGTA
jgi:hypothetical protein